MAARGLGLDEGSATIKAVEVEKRGATFVPVKAVALAAADEGGFDPGALGAALKQAGVKSGDAVLGLTGKDLVIKYQQVPAVPDFQLRKIVQFELDEIRRQSGDDLAADYNVMQVAADLTSDDIVMLALTREARLAERGAALAGAKLKARHYAPNAIALYHAFRVFGPATTGDALLVSFGRGSTDFAVTRDGDLLYARSVNTGGDVLTDALAEQFNVGKPKAESLKRELGDLRPRDRRSGLSAQQEKVSYALEGAAGRLFSLVQSTLQLAKGQMQLNQLNVAKVWITGGTAQMKGLDDYLAASLGVPVEKFDPVGDAAVAVEGPAQSIDLTVALGLAILAADADCFSVEVVPAAERKRREFARKHAFTFAALVLVLAYLGVAYWRMSGDYAHAESVGKQLTAQKKKRDANEQKLAELKAARADLALRVDQLEKRKAAGDGVLRALELLVNRLPDDLWIKEIELRYPDASGADKEKLAKTPRIFVDGAGKSLGTHAVDESYTKFLGDVQALKPDVEDRPCDLVNTQNSGRDRLFEFQLTLSYLTAPKPAAADETPQKPAEKPKPANKKGSP
jgi:type IV pilus assembly protein PilM